MLVILAAVTLNSIFGSNIIGLATNGAINYAEEQQKELGMLNDVSDMLGDITGDTDRPMSPTITLSGTKGNNDIYTSNVMVTISINKGLEQTETIKLHYKINDGEEQISEEDVSFEVSEEGTTTITAWAENERGNVSNNAETSFTINKSLPSTPTISLNGTEGENGYYITNVGVTISAGNATNVASIRYKVEGANPIAETEQAGTTASFNITTDGTSTITAYIINGAGLTSETISQVVNKDTVAPSTATITTGTLGETSVSVTANGEDATSGVASYAFQYSTTNEENSFITMDTVDNTSNSCTFTYQNLASNTTYYLRVIVKDKAGNTTPSIVVSATTKKAGLSDEVLASNVGKYVDYTPVSGTFSDHVDIGFSDTPISTMTNLKWRILESNNNVLTLISDQLANPKFTLTSYLGYNNGVLLLNNACKAMYSNNTLGATGRSLNIDDIEKYMSYDKNSDPNYGKEFIVSSRTYYPLIFKDELTGAVDGTYGSKYGLSDQDSYILDSTQFVQASTLKGKSTYFRFTISANTMKNATYADLLGSSDTYWLASRFVEYDSEDDYFSFCIFSVSANVVAGPSLFTSFTGGSNSNYAIRPVVEIDLTKVNVGLSGDGSADTPFSIEAK